jgi:hypothetical protein
MVPDQIAEARKHVALARTHVERHRQRIASGVSTGPAAERLLASLEGAQKTFEDELEGLLADQR